MAHFLSAIAADVLLGLILITLIMVGALLYGLVKQQGRLLLRLDVIEDRFRRDGPPAPLPAGQNESASELPVAATVAHFCLPDLDGQLLGPDNFESKQMLLIHWSPGCGFCELIAPAIVKLQPDLQKHDVQLVLVAWGEAEVNRKFASQYGLTCPIVLLKESSQVPEIFKNRGTPAACLLDERRQPVNTVALGSEQVSEMARHAAGLGTKKRLPRERPLIESRIPRDGLSAGTRAPSFELPDLRGILVSIEEFRGKRVLLVFTDPHCGPCDRLAPKLAGLWRDHNQNGLALIMVGRGELAENRRKAEAHGINFPFVLQRHWEVSKAYGIFATPVAFLISEEGEIVKNVVKGEEQILNLAQEALGNRQEVRNAIR